LVDAFKISTQTVKFGIWYISQKGFMDLLGLTKTKLLKNPYLVLGTNNSILEIELINVF
jgi:hypothetical protein